MTTPRCLIALLTPLLFATPTTGQEQEGDRVAARVDEYLSRAEAFGFAGGVLLAVDGKVILERGYGFSPRGEKAPITARTRFHIGSLTKQFTAAAVLKLEMQGRLRLEDTIADYLPDVPSDKAAITIQQLLTHTSGVVGEIGDDEVTKEEAVRKALAFDLDYRPGSSASYSNAGYQLLAAIVENASTMSYAIFLDAMFFEPLEMKDTALREAASWNDIGAAGVDSTLGDLHRWLIALEGTKVLSDQAKRRLYATTRNSGKYAAGWRVANSRTFGKVIWHDGDFLHTHSTIRRYVDRGVTLIYFDRTGVRSSILNKILLIPLGHETELPPETTTVAVKLDEYTGQYELDPDNVVHIWIEDDQLWAGATGQRCIDALMMHTPAERETCVRLNGTTADIVGEIARGVFVLAKQVFDNRIPDDVVESAIQKDWEGFRSAHGEFRTVEILGTSQSARSTHYTYARLWFERGVEIYRFEWSDRVLSGINETARLLRGVRALPATRAYVSQRESVFVTYDLGSERMRSLTFSEGPALLLADGNERVRLRKK